MRNLYIAAAVAASLGAATAQAAPPTLGACKGAAQIYVAGSSAAQTAIVNALSDTLFSPNNYTIFTGAKPANNFIAVCGVAQTSGPGAVLTSGTTYVLNYRFEGGSVVGVLPVATHKTIKFLDITGISSVADTTTATAFTINGYTGSAANRAADSFGVTAGTDAKFQTHTVEVGISDVEPSLLTGSNYPGFYSKTVFGSATVAQMGAVKSLGTQVFQQGFGVFVNGNITGATYPLKLSKATIGQILRGEVADWSHVLDVNGNPVATASQTIVLKNRELGSGSRTATDVYFNGTGCGGTAGAIKLTGNANDFASTGDVLKVVNSTAGAVTYASLNNDPNSPNNGGGGLVKDTNDNLSVVWVDGVGTGSGSPLTQKGTATGSGSQDATWSKLIAQQRYDFFAEAYVINNTVDGSALAQDFYAYVTPVLQALATAPHTAQIVAINGLSGNSAAGYPTLVSDAGTAPRDTTIYVNGASRGGDTCSAPVGATL